MHARMTVARPKAEQFDAAVRAVEETFVAAAREQDGYRGFLLLAGQSRQEIVGISFWDTESAVQSTGSGSGYYRQQMTDFVGLLQSDPTTTVHDVIVREP